MDTPRHRFRRDSVEGEASLEGASPIELELRSLKKELETVSLSSAIQARDSQALQARMETLEQRSGGDVEGVLGKVFDHIELLDDRIDQVFDRFQVLESRLQEVGYRLDNLGEIGRLENLPALLEQSLVTSLDDLEARFEARLGGVEAAGSGSVDGEALKAELGRRNDELRTEFERQLESRLEEVGEYLQEVLAGVNLQELQTEFESELTVVRDGLAQLQESVEKIPSEEELQTLIKDAEVDADSPAMVSLQGDIDELTKKLKSLEGLFEEGTDWTDRVKSSVELLDRSAEVIESHRERVDLAVRLVKQLEEGTERLSRPEQPAGGAAAAGGSQGRLVPPAGESQLKLTLRDLMREMVKNRVSDLHIKTGRPITARIGRELIQFSTPPLTPADSYHLIVSALKANHEQELVEERDVEFVYQYESVRLRANVFFDRGHLSATFKMLATRPPELESLGLPKAFAQLLTRSSGLVILAGLPGSGRSTTLTASLDYLNRTKQLHMVSLEDRIDYTHEDRRSLVTQRELGVDISSFAQGTRRAIGQDCDVLFVADLYHRDTMESVFAACEAGLLVVGAVTAHSVEDAIPRLISLFPESERKLRAIAFAGVVQGLLTQKLYHRAEGDGMIPAAELLLANDYVKQAIQTANLSVLQGLMLEGAPEGMQTFAQSVERLLETGLISGEEAQRDLSRGWGEAQVATSGSLTQGSTPEAEPGPPSGTSPPRVQASTSESFAESNFEPQEQPPEAFGEEDTLMNWL